MFLRRSWAIGSRWLQRPHQRHRGGGRGDPRGGRCACQAAKPWPSIHRGYGGGAAVVAAPLFGGLCWPLTKPLAAAGPTMTMTTSAAAPAPVAAGGAGVGDPVAIEAALAEARRVAAAGGACERDHHREFKATKGAFQTAEFGHFTHTRAT